MADIEWLRLESNPDVVNPYIEQLGFPIQQFKFHDVLSYEDWAIEMIPKPILAYVLLFPISDNSRDAKRQQWQNIEASGQTVSQNIFYMKQSIENACGTIALLHVMGNVQYSDILQQNLQYSDDSFIQRFLQSTVGMTPEEIGDHLQTSETLAEEVSSAHQEAAQEGQTEASSCNINAHFIAFVPKDGDIYELDGCKRFPINHGSYLTSNEFAEKAAQVIKREYFDKDPEEVRFGIMALAPIE